MTAIIALFCFCMAFTLSVKLNKYKSTLRSLNTPVNITEDKETSIFIFTDENGKATYLNQ
jgi:hypothetical protein